MLNYKISESGLPVYHFQVPDSSVVYVEIIANCGSSHEDSDSLGVAHFLEHLCFQGTPTKNKHQISREQALTGSYNASTDYFRTSYEFNSLNEDFEKGLALLKETVFDSNYPESEFDKEKSVILEEWRMYDNYPSEFFFDNVIKICFGYKEGHPIIGTEESIKLMDLEKLRRFRNKWYGKGNVFIVVVGNVNFDRTMLAVNNTFPNLENVEKTEPCFSEIFCDKNNYLFETDRFDQAAFCTVSKFPSNREIVDGNCTASFFNWALHKYMYEQIRDDLGLCYGVSGSNVRHFDNSYFFTSMLTSNKHLQKAESELTKLFQKIKDDGFPDEIFEICKKQYIYSKIKSLDSVHGIMSTIIGGVNSVDHDSNWLQNSWTKVLDLNYLKRISNELKAIDLQDFANQWFNNFINFSMISTKVS